MLAPPGFEAFPTQTAEEEGPRVRALLDGLPFDVDDLGDEHTVWFAASSVRLAALTVPANTLVLVDGDLHVEGVLDDRPLSSDADNMRGLVVANELTAGTMLLGSEANVGGSVRVAGWLVAESDGDYTLTVGGDLRATYIVALGHHVRVAGGVEATWKIGYLGLPSDVPKTGMSKAFRSELVNQHGGIEIEQLAARILAGGDVRA